MATLATYKTIVQNEVDDDSSRAGSIIEQAIQDTYQEILRFTVEQLAGTTEETTATTIDQRYVTPTNTYQDIKDVLWKSSTDDNWISLDKHYDEDDYYREDVNKSSSTPRKFYKNAGNIYFDVAPSVAGSVKISGVQVQDELSGTTVSIIPERHESVLILGAVARFKAYEGLPDAREYYSEYAGPYYKQGKTGGRLRTMIDELTSNTPIKRPALYGKR